jgi:hypothetical protein
MKKFGGKTMIKSKMVCATILGCFCLWAFVACSPMSNQNRNGNANGSASTNQSTSQTNTTSAPTSPTTSAQPQSTPQPSLPPGQVRVSKQEFGNAWPLTVDEGVLACKGSKGFGAVLFIANGKTYALNGVARGEKIYQEIDSIQAKDPKIPGVKMSVGPLINRGLKLCQ